MFPKSIEQTPIRELFISENKLEDAEKEATTLDKLDITNLDLQWLQVLSEGWATPLKGFMRENEFLQCLHFNCITTEDGEKINQSIPIVLPIHSQDKQRLETSTAISLYYEGVCYAILRQPEIYYHRKEERVARQFGTTNKQHPHIKV